MPVSVIIPNYNGCHILKTTLSENKMRLEEHGISDIIIVDDASVDDSVSYINTHFPSIRVVQNDVNSGFSVSCNKGASLAKEETLLFLNNDMLIKTVDLQGILSYIQDQDCFAVVPKILRQDADKNWVNESITTGHFKGGWFSTENHPSIADGIEEKEAIPLLWACGGAMFVSRFHFEQLQGFDTMMSPFYCEDLDLSYRAWKRGWKILYTEKATCHHQHQATIGALYTKDQIEAIHLRNKYLFIWKNMTYLPYILSHLITVIIKCLTFQVKDTRAIINACLRLPSVIRYRMSDPVECTSDPEILAMFQTRS